MMERLVKGIMLIALILLSPVCLLGKELDRTRIFPKATGVKGTIIGWHINLRNDPDYDAKVICLLNGGCVQVLGENETWYRVEYEGNEGWVHQDFIQIEQDAFIPHSRDKGEEMADYGKLFIGTPYVWGGNDLRAGVDCSGLTQEIYKTFDIGISRRACLQAEDGKHISKEALRPGDLVFFDTSGQNDGQISHVGMYIGDDQFLHADCTRGVMISRLDSGYYTRSYVTSSRILHH